METRLSKTHYFVVEMPLDRFGQGPASPEEAVKTVWQVWDDVFNTVAVFASEFEALKMLEKLNE